MNTLHVTVEFLVVLSCSLLQTAMMISDPPLFKIHEAWRAMGVGKQLWKVLGCPWEDVLWDPRDPSDSVEGCVCMGHPGRILGCP